ncbi:MAG: penicillin-binding protein 1C [Planctomycetota bacterium]|nr:MAG: penicillin-binding protein 1C [Planctomycetota bacterium]
MNKKLKYRLKKIMKCSLIIFFLFIVLCFVFPYPFSKLNIHGESLHIYSDNNELLHIFTNEREDYVIELKYHEISPWLIKATIAAEDKRFYSHCGVDFIALLRACGQNIWNAKRISGASTLTMQLVRMSLGRKRTITSKIIESFYALQVDFQLDKAEILNHYLNYAPYGGNVYGVEMASLRYFNKSAINLTLSEASFIAGLPQSPSRFNPFLNSEKVYLRREFVLNKMFELDMITAHEMEEANKSKFNFIKSNFPFKTPHFVVNLKAKKLFGKVTSYIKDDLQFTVEKIIQSNMRKLKLNGIQNVSVVIYDLEEEGIVSWIGSNDYFDVKNNGNINGPHAKRSAGSVLKPFIYGMAFEAGFRIPGSMMHDKPLVVSSYVPKNYDLKYFGKLSAKKSLLLSRNIPAVMLLKEVGLDSFKNKLSSLGFKKFQSNYNNHGLSLALGSCDVSLMELINAYACIARKGIYRPCNYFRGETKDESVRCFSPEASYLVYDSLLNDSNKLIRPIALKTGTSWEYRDAWAIGFDARFIVGVWAGNFKGKGSSTLIASKTVVPAVERIFSVIENSYGLKKIVKPAMVSSIELCVNTGMRMMPSCRLSTRSLFIDGVSIVQFCSGCDAIQEIKKERLVILSPKNNESYIKLSNAQSQELKLVSSDSKKIGYWFVDGKYFNKNQKKDIYWKLKRGQHKITLCDNNMNLHSIRFTVK